VDFTREPIIETVITPKEGCKLVVRSSKNSGQEEYFVDAVEVVCFGSALFYRTQERPKAFLVPVSDYEILEVREARMVLKNVGVERTIKIGGGKAQKEPIHEKPEPVQLAEISSEAVDPNAPQEAKDNRLDKKRDKRRHSRRRRGREDGTEEGEAPAGESPEGTVNGTQEKKPDAPSTPPSPPVILAPPSTLISETLARYKDNALFKNAFYTKEEQSTTAPSTLDTGTGDQESHAEDVLEALAMQDVSLEPSEYGTLGLENEPQLEEKEIGMEYFEDAPEKSEKKDESEKKEDFDLF
jgi:hypothetical protein